MKCSKLLWLGLLLIGPGTGQAAVTVNGEVRSPGAFEVKPGRVCWTLFVWPNPMQKATGWAPRGCTSRW